MRVVPVRAFLLDTKAIPVPPAGSHRVLGHASDAVLGVGDVDSVPMDRDAVLYVAVRERHLDELVLAGLQRRSWDTAVERPGLDELPGGESNACLLRGQRDPYVRSSILGAAKVRHADGPMARGVLRGERRPVPEIRRAEIHDVVASGKTTLVPGPSDETERSHGEHRHRGCDDTEDQPDHGNVLKERAIVLPKRGRRHGTPAVPRGVGAAHDRTGTGPPQPPATSALPHVRLADRVAFPAGDPAPAHA